MKDVTPKKSELTFDDAMGELRRIVQHTVSKTVMMPDNKIEDDIIAIAETMLALEKAVVREYEQGKESD